MIRALCCLRNWLIYEHDVDPKRNTKLPSTADDQLLVVNRGGNFSNMTDYEGNLTGENTREENMLEGEDYFDDTDWNDRRQYQTKLLLGIIYCVYIV